MASPLHSQRLQIFEALVDAQNRSHVSRASLVELFRRFLSMIPACDNMLDDLQIRLAEVEKGGTFGSKRPLMKIRKVGVRTYICDIDWELSYSMGAINEERDSL